MVEDGQDAIAKLKQAVKDAGGPRVVARAAGMPESHLGNILCGRRDLAKASASKLRPHVTLPAEVWVELLAPMAPPEEGLVP